MASALLGAQDSFLVVEEQVLQPSNPSFYGAFGFSADADGDVAVVGSNIKGAYILRRDGAGTWFEEGHLLPPLGVASLMHARDVALCGDTAFVGDAFAQPVEGVEGGKVLVYHKTVSGVWSLRGFLFSPDGQPESEFGRSLDAGADRLVVGAPGDGLSGPASGAVYIYLRVAEGWVLEATLAPDDARAGDRFGSAVSIDGTRMAIGASGRALRKGGSGAGFVFELQDGAWKQAGHLAFELGAISEFGSSIDLHGSQIAVGASASQGGRGTVHVFAYDGGWRETGVLRHPSPSANDFFGWDVALEEHWLAIGAPNDRYAQGLGLGSVWLAVPQGVSWTVAKRVVPSSLQVQSFGRGVALQNRELLVGAPIWSGAQTAEGVLYTHTLFPASGETYCEATANSTGYAANLWTTGTTSVLADDLCLWAGPVPDQAGLFFYGSQRSQSVFGNGIRCVGGQALYPLPALTRGGVLEHALDLTAPPGAGGQILPGSTWFVQAAFRDPQAGGAGFDLSSGVRLSFTP